MYVRKMLISREDAVIGPLKALVEASDSRTLCLWTADCATRFVDLFERRCPGEPRPREALEAAVAWARGDIKMPVAKRAAHATHDAATAVDGTDPAACAAARVLGHVVGTVHTPGHAIGIALYGVTALIRDEENRPPDDIKQEACDWFYERLVHWRDVDKSAYTWADFIERRDAPLTTC